jgi:hypothetical protein
MMARTVARRQPIVYSAYLNSYTRGIYFAPTGFSGDIERNSTGDLRAPREYVLRVPRGAPPFVAAIRKESVAVPAARAAGVRTPALVAFDDSLDLLPVPYAIYEQVHGEALGLLDLVESTVVGVRPASVRTSCGFPRARRTGSQRTPRR